MELWLLLLALLLRLEREEGRIIGDGEKAEAGADLVIISIAAVITGGEACRRRCCRDTDNDRPTGELFLLVVGESAPRPPWPLRCGVDVLRSDSCTPLVLKVLAQIHVSARLCASAKV